MSPHPDSVPASPQVQSRRGFRARVAAAVPALLCLLTAAACILALTWPWCRHFDGFFLDHWDPPFHAWKLEVMARKILAGDFGFRNRETTLFYPYSGTLYYEALTWPAALAAALLTGLTRAAPEWIYHVVLIAFWSLSAPGMRRLLLSLGVGRSAAFAGGLLFCILPYRLSYANEFQMQMAFPIPLIYLLLWRFLADGRIRDGIGLALMWWLLAVTELNQAVFILFTFPFLAAARFARQADLLGRRRFWIAAVLAALTGLLSLPALLLPYLQQKSAGAVMRPLKEVIRHSIQPLSYLVPFGRFQPWRLDAKTEELWGYPTLAVLGLSLVALAAWLRRRRSAPVATRRQSLPLLPLAVLLPAYALLTLGLQAGWGASSPVVLGLWRLMPPLCTAAALLACLARDPDPSARFMMGLGAAALFCFFLSLGPTMDLHQPPRVRVPNDLYRTLYQFTPLLSGFRAACRFGVFVQCFLVCAAAFGLHHLQTALRRRPGGRAGARLAMAAALLAVAATAAESLPTARFLRFKPVDPIAAQPVARRLAARTEPYVLAAFPMESRHVNGMLMFSLLKDRHLSVYGWAGYFPPYSQTVMEHARRGRGDDVCAELAKLWPDCLLLIDRRHPVRASGRFAAAAPPHHLTATPDGPFVNYPGIFSRGAEIIDQDHRLVLMRLRPAPAATNHVRLFRSDFGRRLPTLRATLASGRETTLRVGFNGAPLETLRLAAGERRDWSARLDPRRLAATDPNAIVFEGDAPFSLSGFRLTE